MKWGLFIISLGCLTICLAGTSEPTSLGMVVSGAVFIGFGFLTIFTSNKLKKRKADREKLEVEEAEFKAEQAKKREEAGKKKQRDNVEKSRQNSNKNLDNE